ncbi:MAG: hypothetical protein O3A63_10735, partial [Proteobacteria bacterium]|nr:hypothetical protein [Pseudomonadota bacterium]
MYSSGLMNAHPYCICIVVSCRSIQHLLEGGGRGAYKDDHPWLVANEFLARAKERDERLVILFATDDDADGKPVPL